MYYIVQLYHNMEYCGQLNDLYDHSCPGILRRYFVFCVPAKIVFLILVFSTHCIEKWKCNFANLLIYPNGRFEKIKKIEWNRGKQRTFCILFLFPAMLFNQGVRKDPFISGQKFSLCWQSLWRKWPHHWSRLSIQWVAERMGLFPCLPPLIKYLPLAAVEWEGGRGGSSL